MNARPLLEIFFRRLILVLMCLALAGAARAQVTAQDNAAKTNYTGGWSSGLNGGTGFGAWTMVNSANNATNFSGFYIEGTANQISVSNKSFALYANGVSGANYAVANRSFNNPLTVGQVFKVKLKTTGIANNGVMGFSLRHGMDLTQVVNFPTLTANSRLSFYFVGGTAGYTIYDGFLSAVHPEVPFTFNGLTIEFAIRTADTYRLSVKNADETVTIATFDDQPLWGTAGDTIDNIACYNFQTGGNENTYFNQFSISSVSLVPPEIQNVLPTNGSVYLPTTSTITFNAVSAFYGISATTNGVKVTLNGTNVPGANLNFTGNSNNWAVTASPALVANTTYNAVITVTDLNGNRATNTFTFNTWSPSATYIEAEDYNFNKGIYNPAPPIGWYAGVTTKASNNIDFLEYGDPTNSTGVANNYRPQDPVWLEPSGDLLDHNNFSADPSITNYAMGFISYGEWQNYTRRLAGGAYTVYARMSGGGASPVMLLERTASATATTASQPRAALGTFVGVDTGNISSNFAFIQLKDFFSQPVTLRFSTNLNTTNTFRITDVGSSAYNFDYLIFVPTAVANTNTQRPYISAGFPYPGAAGVLPDEPVTFTIANRETTNAPASTKLFINGADVSASLVISNHAAGSVFTYSPAFLYPLNTNNTVRAVFTDSQGVTQTNDWQFTTANILVLPPAYALTSGSGTNSGFNMRLVKYPDTWPATAAPAPLSSAWAEAMLAGGITNTTSGLPYPADVSTNFTETNVIVYQLCGVPSPDGYTFNNPTPFPNVPLGSYSPCANTNGPGSFALSATTYVQLPVGLHKWAVRSDDGFRLSVGNAPTPTNTLIMDWEGGRGAQTPSEFYFVVQTPGLYPMRLLYYQGGFGASVELYSIDRNTGTPIQINNATNAAAIKAYRSTTAGAAPVVLLNPQRGGGNTSFSFVTQASKTHTIQYKNAFSDASWQTLRVVTGTGASTNIVDATAAGTTRFYRVATQ